MAALMTSHQPGRLRDAGQRRSAASVSVPPVGLSASPACQAGLPPGTFSSPPVHGKFTGKYEHRVIKGGIGLNLPQEPPHAFAQAVLDVDAF